MNGTANKSSRTVLMLIMAVFLAPMVGAWIAYAWFPDAVRGLGTRNHGTFVSPTHPVDVSGLRYLDGQPVGPDLLKGKWTLIYAGSADCAAACREVLYLMRQVRLAQGEEMRRVQRLFMVTGGEATGRLQGLFPDDGMLVATAAGPKLLPDKAERANSPPRVYLSDPRGEIMMYYEIEEPLKTGTGMRKDLQKLLRNSQIG